MICKFLIDECLTPRLRTLAVARGHIESTCVRDRSWQGTLDHDLMQKVLAENFTLVTNNAVDFRGGGPDRPGGWHSKAELHCGLVCLNARDGIDLDMQRAMFAAALDLIEERQLDMVNQALELCLLEDATLEYVLYEIPATGSLNIIQVKPIPFQPYLDQVARGVI